MHLDEKKGDFGSALQELVSGVGASGRFGWTLLAVRDAFILDFVQAIRNQID